MTAAVLEARIGAQLWFDGEVWTVCDVGGEAVRLQGSDGRHRTAAIPDLIAGASALDQSEHDASIDGQLSAVVLASLTAKQRAALEAQVGVFAALLESRTANDDAQPLHVAAAGLGLSLRTVQRRLRRFDQLGPAGLIDERLLKESRRSVDPRWDAACVEVLSRYTNRSTPSQQTVIRETNRTFLESVPEGVAPSRSIAYERVLELDAGRYTFGDAPRRRSVAKRPQGVLGQLRPTRPGEYVLMDGYKLDVFAMEPVTMRWVNTELTVAMDLYDRGIKGIRLRPVAAKSADVAGVLLQCLTPQQWGHRPGSPTGPYAGVPEHVVLGSVGVLPDTIVIDHGKVYVSEHTMGVCRRLGISVQPAIPDKPTDKAAMERFFRTLRQSLLDKLTGYKGEHIASRGKDVENGAFYYVTELEQLIREWVGEVYHVRAHAGLRDPLLPKVDLSPQEMFNRGIAVSGLLRLPAAQDLRYELMEVAWRQIHHYGVDVDGRRYDGAGLNPYRGHKSDHGGAHPGKWPILVDIDDVRAVYIQDPSDKTWHRLEWRLAAGINAPFSRDAANYTRRISVTEHRHVDPQQAVEDLLVRWSREEVLGRRERNLAIRLATQPSSSDNEADDVADRASLPGVIDLLTARQVRQDATPDHPDDLDVFERYYAEHPDSGVLEVFDE
ncbi:MAG TPA: transposase [Ornithinibacter sp.]|nr:transposase [Ornithinibacter sp.]